MPPTPKDWKHLIRTDYRDGRLVGYTIAFYRPDGEWYDQITYDSHERKKGRLADLSQFGGQAQANSLLFSKGIEKVCPTNAAFGRSRSRREL